MRLEAQQQSKGLLKQLRRRTRAKEDEEEEDEEEQEEEETLSLKTSKMGGEEEDKTSIFERQNTDSGRAVGERERERETESKGERGFAGQQGGRKMNDEGEEDDWFGDWQLAVSSFWAASVTGCTWEAI